MQREVYKFLSNYSSDAEKIDRLITSTYLNVNNIDHVQNNLIKDLIIQKNSDEWQDLLLFRNLVNPNEFGFEDLIELFEFVVSPSDKIINGAVYTPNFIRQYILQECFNNLDRPVENCVYADFACGCGAFLFSIAAHIRSNSQLTYAEIFPKLYGLDITSYSINRSKILLSLLAISDGSDDLEFNFSLYCGNALSFDFLNTSDDLRLNGGFDMIVGNPPYVCSRNMDEESLNLLQKWSVTKTGHPDLYIPFFQIGYENLKENGILGLITVNTFIKSINGRALRDYFSLNRMKFKLINFGGEQIFRDRNTYTCLCFIQKHIGRISYRRTNSNELSSLKTGDFHDFDYADLNNHDGWNLVDSNEKSNFINKVESTGKPFKDRYETRNGIATLKNNVYKFLPSNEDENYFYLVTKDLNEYKIEKKICRNIINANKLKEVADIEKKLEQIIFPYYQQGSDIKILDEDTLIKEYPFTYKYLCDFKADLASRDKGLKKYEKWYAYGRRQSMDIDSYKLFFPHICERPNFVISKDKNLLFYNGIAVISNDIEELRLLKSILESDVFFNYIRSTTKDYSSGYISMSKNYLKNFGIPEIPNDMKQTLIKLSPQSKTWEELYKLN